MPPILNNDQYTCSLIPMEGKQQDEKPHLIPFFPTYHTSNGEATNQKHYLPQKAVDENNHSNGSSAPISFQFMPISDDHSKNYVSKRVVSDPPRNETVKWMSSKMRLMRKMMSSCPQQQEATGESSSSNYNNCSINGNTIRVCSDCNTTKTPLWRSGPQGPKSLCNACGIRQRKARKAMAAAKIDTIPDQLNSGNPPAKACKQKVWSFNGSTVTTVVPFKKRYKMEQSEKKIGLEDFGINLNKISDFHHPQDEKEAAILLMALSCDLMCS